MYCPKCSDVSLTIVKRNNIELDWCPECKGFWFDALEWELLGLKGDKNNPLMYEAVKTDEKNRKCPMCGKTMEKIDVDGILLDRCPTYHGVWFDKGELSAFINRNSSSLSPGTTKLVKFLGEVFNVKK